MIKVKKEGVLLNKTDLEFENRGVLNPAVIREAYQTTLSTLVRSKDLNAKGAEKTQRAAEPIVVESLRNSA